MKKKQLTAKVISIILAHIESSDGTMFSLLKKCDVSDYDLKEICENKEIKDALKLRLEMKESKMLSTCLEKCENTGNMLEYCKAKEMLKKIELTEQEIKIKQAQLKNPEQISPVVGDLKIVFTDKIKKK